MARARFGTLDLSGQWIAWLICISREFSYIWPPKAGLDVHGAGTSVVPMFPTLPSQMTLMVVFMVPEPIQQGTH